MYFHTLIETTTSTWMSNVTFYFYFFKLIKDSSNEWQCFSIMNFCIVITFILPSRLQNCLLVFSKPFQLQLQTFNIFPFLWTFSHHITSKYLKGWSYHALCLCSTISNKFQINKFFLLWFVIHNIHFHFQNSSWIGILFSYHDLHYHYIPVNQNWIQ